MASATARPAATEMGSQGVPNQPNQMYQDTSDFESLESLWSLRDTACEPSAPTGALAARTESALRRPNPMRPPASWGCWPSDDSAAGSRRT